MRWFLMVMALACGLLPALATAEDKPEIFVQTGHSARVDALAISLDGRLALSGGMDRTIVLWDLASGREIRKLAGHSGWISALAFSPNGQQALSGSWDGSLKLWDLATGREILGVASNLGRVSSVGFGSRGSRLLSASALGGLQVWDAGSGAKIRSFPEGVSAAALSADGRLALSSGMFDGNLSLTDIETGTRLRSFPHPLAKGTSVSSIAFSPDGRLAMSSATDESLMLWDVGSGNRIRTMRGRAGTLSTVVFSPDGRKALSSGSTDKAAVLWDLDSGNVIRKFDHAYGVPAVAFSPDGRQLLSASFNLVKLWDAASGKEGRTLSGQSGVVTSIAHSPDGRQILTAHWAAGTQLPMKLWDAASGKVLRTFAGHAKPVNSVAISPDGSQAISAGDDGLLMLWDMATARPLRSWKAHGRGVMFVAFSPNGKQAISSGVHDKTAKLWDISTGDEIREFAGHKNTIMSLAFSADGSRVLSGSLDTMLKLWDCASGKELVAFKTSADPMGMVHAVALSPDGRSALSGGADKTLKLWDIATGDLRLALPGHAGPIKAVSFSPDGKFAISGGDDKLLKLWDLATGKQVQSMAGHHSEVTRVFFSPDGKYALSGSADSTIRTWELGSGKELAQFVSFDNGEWLTITPQGHFSASSPRAAEQLNIRIGTDVYGIDQFYDVFYRPDIVEAALAGKDAAGMASLTIAEAIKYPPPSVEKIEAPAAGAANTVKVAYRIRAKGGGIGEVRIFHNGKLVQSDGIIRKAPDSMLGKKASQVTGELLLSQMRSLAADAAQQRTLKGAVTTTRPKPDLVEATVEIEPVPGENDISIVAFNAQNSIQGELRTATFSSDLRPVPPRLHILAVGIDEYKDSSANLKFAVKDARDLVAQWRMQAVDLYGAENVSIESISNAQAGRAGILAGIDALAARVKPTDHFILFVASHGLLLGDQYYMVTADYDGSLTPEKLISANEFVDFSKRIKALSQLYILDSCHAGGVEGVVSALYDARVSVLAKKMGLHVFASASSAQEALDGYQGNGLFTHTLLAGLNNNKRADTNGDRQVSLTELGAYSKGQTREIARRMNHKQDPLIIDFGKDSPVYRLREAPQ